MAETPAKIQVKCPCGAVLAVSAKQAAATVTCPKCARRVAVPAAGGANWYVARNKEKVGPCSSAQLRQMAAAGQLGPEDMVLRDGQQQWVKAGSVGGLFPGVVSPVPAPAGAEAPTRAPSTRWGLTCLLVGVTAVVFLGAGACGGFVLMLSLVPAQTQLAAGTGKGAPAVGADRPGTPGQTAGRKENPDGATEDGSQKKDDTPAGPGAAQTPAPRPQRALDLKYIPADASAAVVVHPRRLVQSPLAAAALPPGAADEMVKELGVKPEQVEQVIVFLQGGAAAGPAAAPPPTEPPKDTWVELDSKEGRFSVRFPVQPKPSERKTTLGTRQVFTAEADEGNLTFELSFVDFPKDSPFVGDQSRIDFATRALEFKPGFKGTKDIKLDNHAGAEVVLDDVQLKTYSVHRVYVVGDRLYQLEATTRKPPKPPAEFARFFDSFKLAGADAPAPGELLPADLMPSPGAILRFAEPVDGKQVLSRLLKGIRAESSDGKTYYRSSTGEAFLGLPLAGAVPDERTVLVAPEPVLRKMLAADGGARSPLLDRLRQTDAAGEVTGIVVLEPYRNLLKAVAGPLEALLPPNLADAASLPDRLVAVTATVNLGDETLLKVALEADNEKSVEVLDNLAFQGLNWARQAYPDLRPTLAGRIPAEVVQPALAVADQLFGGIQVTKEGKRLVVRLEKPEGFGAPAEKDLIASAGFNDARGMNGNPVPGSPYPLDTPNREGGAGEPGWEGPWLAHPDAVFQSKVAFEGDGALFLTGRPNFGPNYGRQLAQPQTGRFQVEYHVQARADTGYSLQFWKDRASGPFVAGPICGVQYGKFHVNEVPDTGIKCEPGRWYKVTMRIDVPKQTWEFFVDDKRFESPKPLKFRAKVEYLAFIDFIVGGGGAYIDALRVTRLPDAGGKE